VPSIEELPPRLHIVACGATKEEMMVKRLVLPFWKETKVMSFASIVGAISPALQSAFKIIDKLIPDKDEANALKVQIQMAVMGSKWSTPMTIISGIAIVSACLFNLVYKTIGIGEATISFATPEMVILMGIFVLSATGSVELIMEVAKFLIEKMRRKEKEER